MKSFKKHLTEQKKIYSREEMIKWCMYSIAYFDISPEKDNEKWLNDGVSPEGFSIIESKQIVRLSTRQQMSIVTDDTHLPFSFDVYNGLLIEAPNLKEFSFSCVPGSNISKPQFGFIQTDKLDFRNLDYYENMDLYLRHLLNIHPQHLIKTNYSFLTITECDSKHVYDFSNYDNIRAKRLRVYALYEITNLTNLIEKENIDIYDISIESIIFTTDDSTKLDKILNYYLEKINKKEYIMDFTVEMIDNGFEEML